MNTRSFVARLPLTLLFSILLINVNRANAQSERSVPPTSTLWASVVGSTTPSGWFLSQGKARLNRSGNTLTIELLSDQNTVTQTFKGRLTGTRWIGVRDVAGSDNDSEPLEGTLSKLKNGETLTYTLILKNMWTFAAFTVTE